MKRRVVAIVLSLVMAVGFSFSLTSCGGNGGSDDANTLTIWIHNNEASWVQSYQDIADAYMADHEGVNIKFESFPYDDFETKVQTALMSNDGGADIYELWGGWGVDFAPSGALAALPDDWAAQVKDDAYPSTYGALESDGKLYGMPMEFNIECGGLVINNNVLEANGLSVPQTWDEVIAAAVKANSDDVKGLDFVNWDGVMYLWTSMILSQGANYLNEDGTFNLTSPEAVKAWNVLADLLTKTPVTTLAGLDDGSDIEGYQELFAGQAMMVPRGPWCLAEGINDYGLELDKSLLYVPMPFYGDKPGFAAETGWSMGVSSSISEEKQALAFDFLQYFFSDDVIMQHNLACGQIPAKKSVAQDPAFVEAFAPAAPLVGILDDSQFIGFFNTDRFKENVNNTFSSFCKGGYGSTEEALADLEAQCNDMLK